MPNTPKPNLPEGRRTQVFVALRRMTGSHRKKLSPSPNDPATPVRKKPSLDFSLTGLVYCSMMMFMGLAAINSQANLLFGVFGLMIGILLISGVVCRLVLSRLRVTRVLPEYATVGETTTIQYGFVNAKQFWPSLSVTCAELDGAEAFTKQPHAYMLHVAPRMTATVPVELIPKRRGVHHLGKFQLSTSFPFGFIKRALERTKDDAILIYPAVGAVSPRLLALCRSAERSGAHMKPRRGGEDEFYGVKEFRAGENPRWIHWKRTARTGTFVAKEMSQVSPPKLLIMVDTYIRESVAGAHAAVEKSIAMAASLAGKALDSGMAVGLCVWADGWTIIPAQRGKRHCHDILAALAGVPLNRSASPERLIEQSLALVRTGVTPVLFTPKEIQLTLADHVRGGIVMISANSEQAKSWFHFAPNINFTRCMPADQQPEFMKPTVAVSPSLTPGNGDGDSNGDSGPPRPGRGAVSSIATVST